MANKHQDILYLSHGKKLTGGYFHEMYFAKRLANTINLPLRIVRYPNYFKGPIGHIKLLYKSWKDGKSKVVISVARLSIPVILANLFYPNKILLVWHYHDAKANISMTLKCWYWLSLQLIKFIPSQKIKLIAVAPFWVNYFSQKIGSDKVAYFPNYLDETYYKNFICPKKKHQIHLGQVSFKNDSDLIWIANQLQSHGYLCYLSTNDPDKAKKSFEGNVQIRYFETHASYLQEMASSLYTLALPQFNEGWNRVAHESILVGTPVIGYPKGGLADLLHLSRSLIAKNKEEVLNYILKQTEALETAAPPELNILDDVHQLEKIKNWIDKTKM